MVPWVIVPLDGQFVPGGRPMRKLLLGAALAFCFGVPAFAGPPTPPNIAPVQVTVTSVTNVEGAGGSSSVTVHAGPINFSAAESVKLNATVGASLSVATPGWSAP